MNTNHNRIKVADLEKNEANKILITNSDGELEFSDIYNSLDCTVEGKVLDARQGKVLKDLVYTINTLLASDNINLNTIQELANAIESIQNSLNSILVNDLTTGGVTKALTADMGKLLQDTKVDKVAGERLINAFEITKLIDLSGVNTGDETATTIKTKLGISTLSGSNTGDQILPTTLPASDVYAWAKEPSKPTYTKSELGLGNIDNTSDINKPVSTPTQTALNSKEDKSNKNIANGYAGLGSDGKLISSQLPSITISNTFVVASQVEMSALIVEIGDVAVRTDLNKSFILKGTNPTVPGDWQELLSPTDSVTTVFGRNGSVTAQIGDYTADQIIETTSRKFQTANQQIFNDATSSIQAQLNSKEPSFTKNTAFNKNFGTTIGTVAEGNDSRILNGQTAYSWGNHAGLYPSLYGSGASGTWNINISGIALAVNNGFYYKTQPTLDVNDIKGLGTGLYGGSTSGWANQPSHSHNGNALLNIETHPGNYFSQLWFDTGVNKLYTRAFNAGAATSWCEILASNNYNSYSPTLTGGGASGTWGIQLKGVDNTYAKSLLVSGSGRTDDDDGSTWIFADSIVSEANAWGIKHNQLDNFIEFYSSGTRKSYINLVDGSFNGTTTDTLSTILSKGNWSTAKIGIDMNYGGTTPTISLAIGDNDTGFHSTGDGALSFYRNGTAQYNLANVLHAGNYNTYAIKKGGDTVNGTYSLYSNDTSGSYYTRALELREVGLTTAANSGNPAYAPAIGFHWGGVNQTKLLLGNDGQLRIESSGGGSSWGSPILHTGNYNSYSPTLTGGGASGTWGINISGNAATASCLPTSYIGGQQLNPQTYFGMGTGLRVAMTAATQVWSDTLWINGYAGGDVKDMCALHFLRNGQPRMFISSQLSDATSYGSQYEVLTDYNYSSRQSFTSGLSIGTAGTRTGNLANANSIAIGDTDTGFRQNGDGVLETFANNVQVMSQNASVTNVLTGTFLHNGNSIIHGGNIGLQSVNYASSSGQINNINSSPDNAYRNAGITAFYSWNSGQVGNPTGGYSNGITIGCHPGDPSYGFQIAQNMWDDNLYFRRYNSGWQSWRKALDDANFNSFAPSLTGGGASGTWGINITGNATTAGLLNPLNGDSNYKLGFSASGARDNAGEWGRAVMRYEPNGQTYGIRVDRADYADSAGSAPNGNNQNAYYHTTPGDGYGLCFWGSNSYKISMGASGLYTYGTVTDYSIKMNMDNGSPGRGFTWGRESYAPIASLNATSGNFQTAGTIYAGGDVVAYYSSDKRLKDDIRKIENPLHKLSKINGYTFDWNKNQSTYVGSDIGVIAQEIEAVLPEVVTTRDNGYKAVKYEKLIPLLIECVKNQQEQIEAQNEIIARQEKTLEEILKRLN